MMRPPWGRWSRITRTPARAVECARQIDVDDLLPLVVGEIAEHTPGADHAGVVEQDVDAAELVLDLGEQRPDGGDR